MRWGLGAGVVGRTAANSENLSKFLPCQVSCTKEFRMRSLVFAESPRQEDSKVPVEGIVGLLSLVTVSRVLGRGTTHRSSSAAL